MSVTRRQMIATTGALGAGIAVAGSVGELFAGTAFAAGAGGYGPSCPIPTASSTSPAGSATECCPARATR